MKNISVRVALVLAGLTALFVSLSVFWDTTNFYAEYEIDAAQSVSLMSELKAPAGGILLIGALALVGAFVTRFRSAALTLSAGFYLSYAGSRSLSLLFDGVPSQFTLIALASELLLGIACLALWFERK